MVDDRIPEPVPPLPLPEISYESLERGERIGTGGDADVYKVTVEHDGYTYTVAVKEPRFEGTIQQRVVERFQEEANTWSRLDDHDKVVSVYAWGTGPFPWLALEYMDGGTLNERLGDIPVDQALWLAGRIAEGIRHGHRHGIAHLDIKPTNILLRETQSGKWDYPKVSDWGLAKMLLEHSNSVEGMSPTYSAPEQFAPDEFGSSDDITDIYQFGTVVYALLTGKPPFTGASQAIMRSVLAEEPQPPSQVNHDLPPAVDEVVLKALAKDKKDRYEGLLPIRKEIDRLFEAYVEGEADISRTGAVASGSPSPDQNTSRGTSATVRPSQTTSDTTSSTQTRLMGGVDRREMLKYGGGILSIAGLLGGGWWITNGDDSPSRAVGPPTTPTDTPNGDSSQTATKPKTSPPDRQVTDGFESGAYDDGDPATWQVASQGEQITVQSDVVKNGENALAARSSSDRHAILYHHAADRTIEDGDVFSAWMRAEARAWVELTMQSEGRGSGPHSVRAQLFTDHNNCNIDTFDENGDRIEKQRIGSPEPNTWYLIELEMQPSQSELTGRLYDSSKSLIGEKTLATSGATGLAYTRLHVPPLFDTKYTGWFDDVTFTEPSKFEVNWPMFQYDPANTGFLPRSVDFSKGVEPKWRFKTNGPIRSSPAIMGNMLYIGSNDGRLYAINIQDGATQWQFQTNGSVVFPPAVADGIVYFSSMDPDFHIYAVNAADGELRWKANLGNSAMAPTVANGTVYIGRGDGNVYAFNAATGDQKWMFKTRPGISDNVSTAPAVVKDAVVFGSNNSYVVALNSADGSERWRFSTGPEGYDTAEARTSVNGDPTIHNGTVYAGSKDQRIYALDLASGTQQWYFATDGAVRSSPAVDGTAIYVGSNDGHVYSLNIADGTERWRFKTGAAVESSPAVTENTVYIASRDGAIYALQKDNGEQRWNFDTDDVIRGSPAVGDGTIYIGSDDRTVYALTKK